MAGILEPMLWNAIDATILAVAVALFIWISRPGPAFRHALWLLVVVKLLLPPLAVQPFGLSALSSRSAERLTPRWETRDAGSRRPATPGDRSRVHVATRSAPNTTTELDYRISEGLGHRGVRYEVGPVTEQLADSLSPSAALAATDTGSIEQSSSAATPTGPAEAPEAWTAVPSVAPASPPGSDMGTISNETLRMSPWLWVLLVWVTGSVAMATRQLWRILRFHARVRAAAPAPPELMEECDALRRQIGLRAPPDLRTAPASVSPFLWALGQPTVVVPRTLTLASRRAALRGVLAHELAHLKRRDHWVCWLSFIASLVYWWLPTVWVAARELRRAADQSADGWAATGLGSRKGYAESLLSTVQLICAPPAPCPSLGQDLVGERKTLERRLIAIMKEPLRHKLSWGSWVGVIVLVVLALPAAPRMTVGQDAVETPPAAEPETVKTPKTPVDPFDDPPSSNSPVSGKATDTAGPAPIARPVAEDAVVEAPAGDLDAVDQLRPVQQRGAFDAAAGAAPGVEQRLRRLEGQMEQILRELRGLRRGRAGIGSSTGVDETWLAPATPAPVSTRPRQLEPVYTEPPVSTGTRPRQPGVAPAAGASGVSRRRVDPALPDAGGSLFGGGQAQEPEPYAGTSSPRRRSTSRVRNAPARTSPAPGGGGLNRGSVSTDEKPAVAQTLPSPSRYHGGGDTSAPNYARQPNVTPEQRKLLDALDRQFQEQLNALQRWHADAVREILSGKATRAEATTRTPIQPAVPIQPAPPPAKPVREAFSDKYR